MKFQVLIFVYVVTQTQGRLYYLRGYDDPSKAPEICSAADSSGILIRHEDCNKFYQCASGIPVIFKCPANLVYNPNKEFCDWPENYKCENQEVSSLNQASSSGDTDVQSQVTLPKTNNDPSLAPEICAAQGSDSILVAHEQCNKFYKCSEGEPVALDCPGSLLYNPEKEICDWPANVDCGNRT